MKLKHSMTAAAMATALLIGAQTQAAPIVAGDLVSVTNQAGTVFTPTPVAGDTNGLYRNLTIRVDNTTNYSVSAGLFVLDYQSAGSTTWEQFETFCLQPNVYLQPFANPYQAVSLGSGAYAAASAGISELYGRFRDDVVDNLTAAAFQVALWELAYDTGRDLGTGSFQLTNLGSDVAITAAAWLGVLDGTGPSANLLALVSNPNMTDRQDLLVEAQVPEPATLALLGAGLLAGAGWRRRGTAVPA